MTITEMLNTLRLELQAGAALTDAQKELYTHWLNEAIKDVWSTPEYLIWPWIAVDDTLTLVDSAFSKATDIADSDAWTVWSADPEASFAAGTAVSTLALPAVLKVDTITVQAASATAAVVVFYRDTMPQYVWDDSPASTDELPEVFWPWVLADVLCRHARSNRAPQSEATLNKFYVLRDEEMSRLKLMADQTWENAPWLATLAWRDMARGNTTTLTL